MKTSFLFLVISLISNAYAGDPQVTVFNKSGKVIATTEGKSVNLADYSIQFEGRSSRADVLVADINRGVYTNDQLFQLRDGILNMTSDPAISREALKVAMQIMIATGH